MKKTLTVLAVISAAAAALSSCSQAVRTETMEVSEKFALADGRTDSLDLYISAEYPVSGLRKSAGLKISAALTGYLFGEEYIGMEPDAAVGAYMDDRLQEYREENLPMLEISGLNGGAALSWTEYVSGTEVSMRDRILSYRTEKYAFRGGAHGMTTITAYNFSTRTGEELHEPDIFREGYAGPLTEMLTAHLSESLEDPADTSMMFLKKIEPNGNFLLSEEGITYIFNHYEIAPYSMGVINITLPWDEVSAIMKK